MKHTKDRKWYINLLYAIYSIGGYFLIPGILYSIISNGKENDGLSQIIALLIFAITLFIIYHKDLKKELFHFIKNFKSSMKDSIKYYFAGLGFMVLSNLIIAITLKNISANEEAVRSMLVDNPIIMMIQIAILAPLIEEIMFRKSLMPVLKNKWIYALVSGFLFGGAHLLGEPITLTGLVYIIPYSSLGVCFALMNHKNKSTWNSITMHAIHNFCTGALLLLVYGVL